MNKIRCKYHTPRFKKLQPLDVINPDEQMYLVAERAAVANCYAAGSNYTFAQDGKVLDPEARFGDVVQDGARLSLVIR